MKGRFEDGFAGAYKGKEIPAGCDKTEREFRYVKDHKRQRRMDSHKQWLWKTGRSWKVRHRQCMERHAPDIRVLSFYEVFRGSFSFPEH